MSQASTPLSSRRDGRPTKFTPERIEQIKNLVEQGKSRREIAELLNVTVGSLQVTCSRLGISLRRAANNAPKNGSKISTESPPPAGQDQEDLRRQSQAITPHRERMESQQVDFANFTIRIRYKGREREIRLPLSECMISHLALEAELRDMRIGELIDELIVATMKAGILQPLLDGQDVASIRTYLANLPDD
jgi:hypothetical protein